VTGLERLATVDDFRKIEMRVGPQGTRKSSAAVLTLGATQADGRVVLLEPDADAELGESDRLDHHSKKMRRSGGQNRRITLPMMFWSGTDPKVRESDEN